MNILCRWALCRSLQESTTPPSAPDDTVTEIDWAVFAGPAGGIWWSLILELAFERAEAPDAGRAEALLRAHVARGMSYLVGDNKIQDATSLARIAVS